MMTMMMEIVIISISFDTCKHSTIQLILACKQSCMMESLHMSKPNQSLILTVMMKMIVLMDVMMIDMMMIIMIMMMTIIIVLMDLMMVMMYNEL